LIACTFKEAVGAINVSLIVSAFLLLIEDALATRPKFDAAITRRPDIVSQLCLDQSPVAANKNFREASSFGTDKAIVPGE
jgi:hypothetical protein